MPIPSGLPLADHVCLGPFAWAPMPKLTRQSLKTEPPKQPDITLQRPPLGLDGSGNRIGNRFNHFVFLIHNQGGD